MKIGDSVSVVDEQLSGKIIAISAHTVTLEDEHGFSYEYPKQQVVINESTLYRNISAIRKEEYQTPKSKKHQKNPQILDLHFDQLSAGQGSISSFERLFIQKEKLLETLDYCRQHHLKRLEIIHGIGDGVLQQMVYEVLENQTDLEFHNREILHHQSGIVLVYFK